MKLSAQGVRRVWNPQRQQREVDTGYEGSKGAKIGKKSPPGAVTERDTEREKEQRREGLWESFVKGGALFRSDFAGQLSSKNGA